MLDLMPACPIRPQGVRWLGASARLVSHSTEKVAGGYRNTLLITGVGTGLRACQASCQASCTLRRLNSSHHASSLQGG